MSRIRLMAFVLPVVFCCPAGLLPAASAPSEADLRQSLQVFARAYAVVEQNFADPVSPDESIYNGAIQGMLRTLDPHSNFLDPKSYQALQQDQQGEYYGVGMEINMDGPKVIVTYPFPGSPARRAGLRRGDVIASIDGSSAEGLTSAQVADRLKGPRGTTVEVGVKRSGGDKLIVYKLQRDGIPRSDVEGFWLNSDGIAYVRIQSFGNQNTGRDVEQKFKDLGEENIKGLLLDLRFNQGGLVSEAVSVAGRFLQPGQVVVSHRGRASAEQVFRAKGGSKGRYPIVVLVNRHSASAAEIVAGALQDHDRGWVLGESTFGKGLVQAQYPLSEGAALLLTIARYYTPSGRLIQRDYAHTSFIDYYYRRTETRNLQDEKHTDTGRLVYGGGGIAPDEKYEPEKSTAFQRRLGGRLAFFHFANSFFGLSAPVLPENWKPDASVIKQFQAFLIERGIPFSDTEFSAGRAWVDEQLREEMLTRAFDRRHAERVNIEEDAGVRKAVASLPTAQALLKQVLARR